MCQVGVSYLEIYNEAGYDLLAPVEGASVVEDLPRVHIMEDEEGRLHMRNLSQHSVASQEEALNLVRPYYGISDWTLRRSTYALPSIHVLEGEEGRLHMRSLSQHNGGLTGGGTDLGLANPFLMLNLSAL